MKKFKENIWIILFVVGVIGGIGGLLIWAYHTDANGIRVRTDEPSYRAEIPEGIQYPIEVRGYIEYDNDYIVSRDTIVDFCDVKNTKKEMKREMKAIWKEMQHRCENY